MSTKEQLKVSWPFILAVILFILLVLLSATGAYEITDVFFGLSKLLLALTLTYTCIRVSRDYNKKGKHSFATLSMYGAGILSGLWLYDAIQYLL